MAVNSVDYRGNLANISTADTGRGPSMAIWASCPVLQIIEDPSKGLYFFDDFVNPPSLSADSASTMYDTYIDTSNTILGLAGTTANYGGILRLSADATDNDAPVVTTGGGAGSPFIIGNTAGTAFKLWFEGRIRKSSITDNQAAFFLGLAQAGTAADNGLLEDDTGDVVNSISVIGFRVKNDNGEELDFVYQDAAQTAPTEVIANISAMVADTWIKLGFVYDPAETADKKIKIFVNGAEQSTYVTTTNIDAATFPENDGLTPTVGLKTGEATAVTLDMDWWRCAQVYN